MSIADPSHVQDKGPWRHLLTQPDYFLPHLIDSMEDGFTFYSLDRHGNFTFLSKSAPKVLHLDPEQWVGRPIQDAMSDADCNHSLRELDFEAIPSSVAVSGTCELISMDSTVRKLNYWQVAIWHHGEPIGFAGAFSPARLWSNTNQQDALMAKFSRLTEVERQVVERVCSGRQNKSIAAELMVAVRTVEARRARAMAKLEVKSLAELVKAWANIAPWLE